MKNNRIWALVKSAKIPSPMQELAYRMTEDQEELSGRNVTDPNEVRSMLELRNLRPDGTLGPMSNMERLYLSSQKKRTA